MILTNISRNYSRLVVIEDAAIAGGAGSAILEYLATIKSNLKVKLIGVEDSYVEHGSIGELYNEVGLSVEKIVAEILTFVE